MKRICSLLLAILMMFSVVYGVQFTVNAQTVVTGDQIVAEARKHVGKPYQLGKAGPDIFDCSGLTMYVYAKFGISLPHSTYDIYNNPTKYGTVVGKQNSCDEAAPGDLVCWYGHIGIYTGVYDYYGTKRPFLVDAANSSKGVVEQPVWPSNGDYFILHVKGIKDTAVVRGNMTVPTISLDKATYGVANTMKITWSKTSSETDFRYYKVQIKNNINGDSYYSGYTTENDVEDNTVSYKFTVPGEYIIYVYAIPYNQASSRQKVATKIISVGTKVDKIDDVVKVNEETQSEYVDTAGWIYDSLGNVYFGINDTLATGWLRYSKVWYFFDVDNTMHKGWLDYNSNTYYLSNGPRLSGKQLIDDKYYILSYADGQLLKGKVRCDGVYYITSRKTGEMLYGKVSCDGIYYILNKTTGEMLYGMVTCDGKKYIMSKTTGEMLYGMVICDGVRYIMNEKTGEMLYGAVTYNDNNYITNKTTGELMYGKVRCDGKYYVMNPETGEMMYGLAPCGDVTYITDEKSGVMLTGMVTYDGKKYVMSKTTGEMLYGMVTCDGKKYIMSKTTGELLYGIISCDGAKYLADSSTGELLYGKVDLGDLGYILNKATGEMLFGKVRCDGNYYITSKFDGHIFKNGIVSCDGVQYRLDADGIIVEE